jgi:hypothetical protein
MSDLSQLFFFCEGAAAALALAWLLSARSVRLRRSFRLGLLGALPYPFRLAPSVAPLLAALFGLVGLAVVVPRGVGVWLAVPIADVFVLAMVMAYRWPTRLMPGWLRDEVAKGESVWSPPDKWDWLYFWMAVPLVAGLNIAIPLLLL